MIHFVLALPPTLEPNSIYYVETEPGKASHFVADNEGNPVEVSTEALVQAYMASQLSQKADASNVYSRGAVDSIESGLQGQINQKANASDVYTQSAVDSIESGLQSQINAKQGNLSNATDVAKLGNGTFDGKPIVLVESVEW